MLAPKLEAYRWVQSDADPRLHPQHNDDCEIFAATLVCIDELQFASKFQIFVDYPDTSR